METRIHGDTLGSHVTRNPTVALQSQGDHYDTTGPHGTKVTSCDNDGLSWTLQGTMEVRVHCDTATKNAAPWPLCAPLAQPLPPAMLLSWAGPAQGLWHHGWASRAQRGQGAAFLVAVSQWTLASMGPCSVTVGLWFHDSPSCHNGPLVPWASVVS